MGKLVRGKLKESILNDYPNSQFIKLDHETLKYELKKKLVEEATELLKANRVEEEREELGDVLEIIDTFFRLEYFNKEKVTELKQQKLEKNGGFKDGLYWKIESKKRL